LLTAYLEFKNFPIIIKMMVMMGGNKTTRNIIGKRVFVVGCITREFYPVTKTSSSIEKV